MSRWCKWYFFKFSCGLKPPSRWKPHTQDRMSATLEQLARGRGEQAEPERGPECTNPARLRRASFVRRVPHAVGQPRAFGLVIAAWDHARGVRRWPGLALKRSRRSGLRQLVELKQLLPGNRTDRAGGGISTSLLHCIYSVIAKGGAHLTPHEVAFASTPGVQ